MVSAQRTLNWHGCFNVRDLGGLPVGSGATTCFKRIVRADNLDRLTEAGFEALLEHGIQNIIDLREEIEVSRYSRTPVLASWHGLRLTRTHLLHELSSRERAMLATCRDTAQTYLWILKYGRQGIARTVRELNNAAKGGTVIHCHAGRDRTGIVAALLLSLTGVSENEIAEDYAFSAFQLSAIYDDLAKRESNAAGRAALAAENRANACDLLVMLRTLREEFGSVRSYLIAAGLSDAELNRAAEHLLVEL